MKLTFLLLILAFALQGCLVSGKLEYHDAKTGAPANLGISHDFSRKDGKRVIPLE